MQLRFIKDLAIILIVVFLLSYAVNIFIVKNKGDKIRANSRYSEESVSDSLRTKIQSIEASIVDRENYVFSITHDPLKQGNIIKDRFDRNKEYENMILGTFRLMGTYTSGNASDNYATIEYMNKTYYGKVGDNIEGRIIQWIGEDQIGIYYGGNQTLRKQPIPPPPAPEALEQKDLENY
jgi:hypothetical protein